MEPQRDTRQPTPDAWAARGLPTAVEPQRDTGPAVGACNAKACTQDAASKAVLGERRRAAASVGACNAEACAHRENEAGVHKLATSCGLASQQLTVLDSGVGGEDAGSPCKALTPAPYTLHHIPPRTQTPMPETLTHKS